MAFDFDVIVIGAGAAGLTASGIAANFGAKTLMIERHRMGGDCTWTGCVPSKAILKGAKIAHHMREAAAYGITEQPVEVNFKRVMERVRHIREEVYEDADRPEIYEKMGIDVRSGHARFEDAHTLILEKEGREEKVSGRYIVIAAGASAFVPPIQGLGEVPHLTNDSLFETDTLPGRLAIVGGGPIGTEMSQAFARFGSDVTVIDMGSSIMSKDDPELSGLLMEHLKKEGIRYEMNASVQQVSHTDQGIHIHLDRKGTTHTIEADALLMATGRRPNLAGLNLEAAGVAYTQRGITVNENAEPMCAIFMLWEISRVGINLPT